MDLTKEDINKLEVIADIGAQNASKYLTQMMNKKVSVSIPWVASYPYEKIPETVDVASRPMTAVFMEAKGDIRGIILIVFPRESALLISDLLLSREGTTELDDLGKSALTEATGNILANAYLNAFSEKLDLKVQDTIPFIGTDMLNALMDGVLARFACQAEEALVLKNNFRIDEKDIKGHAFILFDPISLNLILEKLRECKIK